MRIMVGRVQDGRITTYTMTSKGQVVGHTRPCEHAVKPVQPVQAVDIDVPAFMKKERKPAPKPVVKQGKMSFAQILAEAERILKDVQ